MENEVDVTILPRTEDLVKWLVYLVPVIFLLLWDVWKAWKRRALWIPAQALVLSTPIIELLSFIDYSHISVYSGSSYQTEEVVAVLVKNQLVIDSGRLMMCVLIAYLLPGMARSGSTTLALDLASLVLSIILNILSEVQSVWKVEKRNESMSALAADYNVETKGSDRKWSKVCSTTLFIATIYLLLLLIQVAKIGITIRRIMSQKITSALSCCCTPCDRPRCNETKDHVLKCWMVARVSQPDYVLVRSGLCSTAWVYVTVCIVVSVIKWRYVQLTNYESLNSGNQRTLTQFVIVGQLVIVLIGWIVVFIREVNFVSIRMYDRNSVSRMYDLNSVSKYFVRMSIEDAENDFDAYLIGLLVRDKRIQEKMISDRRKKPDVLIVYWLQKLRVSDPEQWLQKLRVLAPGHWLQKLRVPLSKLNGYWFQISFSWVVKLEMLLTPLGQPEVSNLVHDNGQFSKYKESLEMLLIPGESASSLWKANQWGFREVERYMDQGHEDGKRSPSELIFLLRLETGTAEGEAGKSAKEGKAPLQQANKNSWKRTTVSLIHLMIYFYDGSDDSVIENAMQCYIQGWEYMNFVDGLNEEVKSLGRQADREFESLEHSWNKRAELGMLETEIKQPLSKLKSCSNEERRNLQNSRDSTEVAKYCLSETWTVIGPYLSAPEINNEIHRLQCVLANVYFFYMTEDLNKAVLQKCSKLAEEGMEEEILDVAFLSAKAQGVLDKVGEGNDPKDPGEPPHNTDQGSISSPIQTEIEVVSRIE
eukprot:PITA_36447